MAASNPETFWAALHGSLNSNVQAELGPARGEGIALVFRAMVIFWK
jgi:hypothetical protein